jgi:hypothetical protein
LLPPVIVATILLEEVTPATVAADVATVTPAVVS